MSSGVALTGTAALVAGCGEPGGEEPDAEEETGNGQDPNGDDEDEDEDEADDNLTAYNCAVHPDTMDGEIDVDS